MVGLSEQLDTFLLKIRKKKKKKQCRPKSYFWVASWRGVLRKMVLLKFYLFQRLLRSILCLGIQVEVNESFPTVKIAHQSFVAWKTTLLINGGGGVRDFFRLPYSPTLGENSNFKLLSWRKSQKKHILKIRRLYPLRFLQYYMFRSPHRLVYNWKVRWPYAFLWELQHRLQYLIKTSYTEQITRAKVILFLWFSLGWELEIWILA